MEDLDRIERRKHEEQERELLLRAAKSRAKTEDPKQAELKAKAKEVIYNTYIFAIYYKLCYVNSNFFSNHSFCEVYLFIIYLK